MDLHVGLVLNAMRVVLRLRHVFAKDDARLARRALYVQGIPYIRMGLNPVTSRVTVEALGVTLVFRVRCATRP